MDRKWWTLIAVCIGTFMLLLDITIVNVALPAIGQAFRAQLSDLQWVVDAYALSLAALLLTTGSLADLYGRRLVYAIGTGIFTAGSLLCGTATGPLFLILARAAQGVGGATMFATSLALIAQAFTGRERGTAFGAFGAVSGVAVALGPVLGGLLTTGLSWRWIFFVNVPVGVVAIGITLVMIDESREPRARRPDWLGFATFTGALSLLTVGLIRGAADGWSSALILTCFVAAAALLALFLVVELKSKYPMFPMNLLRKPTFSGGLISAFCLSASIFSILTYVTLYLQEVLHLSARETGVRFLVLSGTIFVVATIAGRLTSKVPTSLLIGPGFVAIGVGLLLMHGVAIGTSWTHLIPGFILGGIGTGLVTVPLASTAIGVVPPQQAGVASGINSTFRQVGIATGIAALGSVLTSSSRDAIVARLVSTPLAPAAHRIANVIVASGGAPVAARGVNALAIRRIAQYGFDAGLNDVFVVGACTAFVGAIAALTLIRQRDFVAPQQAPPR
jgi:EmrB/QacA subfamily drug resistance transporter